MTSDSGVAKQYSDYARQIQETLDELQHMQETPRLVTSPDEREALERAIRQRTDLLAAYWSATTYSRLWIRSFAS